LFSTVIAFGLEAAPLYVPAGSGSWKMPFRSGSVVLSVSVNGVPLLYCQTPLRFSPWYAALRPRH